MKVKSKRLPALLILSMLAIGAIPYAAGTAHAHTTPTEHLHPTGDVLPDKPPKIEPIPAEELLGTYDLFYSNDDDRMKMGKRVVDLRILNERLTFVVIFPYSLLGSTYSFSSYDPAKHFATLEIDQEDEDGVFTASCKVTFHKVKDKVCVLGVCKQTRGGVVEKSYTFSGNMRENGKKLHGNAQRNVCKD